MLPLSRLVARLLLLLIVPVWLLSGCGSPTSVEPPVVSDPQISAPTPQEPGQEIGISVDVSSVSGVSLTYDWRADGGEIVRGQNSPAITYRTPDEPGIYNVRVAVKWGDSSIEKITTIRVEAPEVAAVDEPPPDTPTPKVEEVPPTATPVPPTATRKPTNTPRPPTDTPTPRPTNTPRPTPVPTATIDADPTVYDNFNNPANNGGINSKRWDVHSEGAGIVCEVSQSDGVLALTAKNTGQSQSCFLFGPSKVFGRQLKSFEARIKMPDQVTDRINTNLVMSSDGFSGGGWMECGLEAYPEGANAAFYIAKFDGAVREIEKTVPAERNRWYTLRYDIDPDTMTVSCFIDNVLVGSTIPEDAAILKSSSVFRYIQSYIPTGVSTTIFIDDVRIVP